MITGSLVSKMKTPKLAFLILLIIVILATILIIHIVSKPNLSQEINTYMNANEKSFSGTVLVAEGGNILFEKAYGMSDYATHKPNSVNTEYQIASITKQFTAMAIMQLQAKGKLNLNDKLSKYFPQNTEWKNITIKELLTHTSGIPDYTQFENPTTPESVPTLLKVIENRPLDFAPGTSWKYSNSNYLLLGYLVEKLSGLSYINYLKINILAPLHMTHTGLYTPQSAKTVSVGYNLLDGVDPSRRLYLYGDGGLYSTVQDLYKWDRALYSTKLASAKDLKQIFSPQANTGNQGISYGYGWFISGSGINEEIFHSGSLPGYLSFIARYPAKDMTIIVLTNNSSSSSSIGSVVSGLEALNFNLDPNLLLGNKPKPLTQKQIKSVVGNYKYERQKTFPKSEVMTIAERNNQLFENGTNQLQLVSKTNGHIIFKSRLNAEWLVFNTDFTGHVFNVTKLSRPSSFVLTHIK